MDTTWSRKIGLVFFMVFFFFVFSAGAVADSLTRIEHVPGELIIKLKQETMISLPKSRSVQSSTGKAVLGITSLDKLASQFKAVRSEPVFKSKMQINKNVLSTIPSRVTQDFDTAQYQKIVFSEDADLDAIIKAYKNDPNIEFAEPNYIRRPIGSADGSPYNTEPVIEPGQITSGTILSLPGNNTDEGYIKQWHLDAINAPQAWSRWDWLETPQSHTAENCWRSGSRLLATMEA